MLWVLAVPGAQRGPRREEEQREGAGADDNEEAEGGAVAAAQQHHFEARDRHGRCYCTFFNEAGFDQHAQKAQQQKQEDRCKGKKEHTPVQGAVARRNTESLGIGFGYTRFRSRGVGHGIGLIMKARRRSPLSLHTANEETQ